MAALLTACSSPVGPGRGPMGRGPSSGPGGAGMMGGGSGYHYRSAVCAAPASLPGSLVRVVLADMGMTRMSGGTAPLGAPMMLRLRAGVGPRAVGSA